MVKGHSDFVVFDFEPGSFRDRNGRVFFKNNRVLRVIGEEGLKNWEALSATQFFERGMKEGKIIQTERISDVQTYGLREGQPWYGVLEHQRIPIISYPYEWCFGMLKDAALLHLDILLDTLKEDMILKDSSPYNIQWMGSRPTFIDILSFEKCHLGDAWAGYRQFCQLFLYPLFLQAYKDVAYHAFLRGSIDGITVEQAGRIFSLRDLFRRGVFTHCFLQNKLQSKYANRQSSVATELKSAGFGKEMIRHNAQTLLKIIRDLSWNHRKSEWSEYADCKNYATQEQQRKIDFVRQALQSSRWELVWDLGCNTGVYSRIASENAGYVIAMDADHLSVELFYQELKSQGAANVLPLVMNVCDFSPNLGWRGMERRSLIERGKPDLVLCLALIHHLVISNNIPLGDFIDWLAELGCSVVIEFVSKDDAMVKRLLLNKKDNYLDYDRDHFEQCLSRRFKLECREVLESGNRTLYFARNAMV